MSTWVLIYDHELITIEQDKVEVERDSSIGNEIDGPFVCAKALFSLK
jgi:hypothetical protein